jgi:hypothetical protein
MVNEIIKKFLTLIELNLIILKLFENRKIWIKEIKNIFNIFHNKLKIQDNNKN